MSYEALVSILNLSLFTAPRSGLAHKHFIDVGGKCHFLFKKP